MDGYGADSFYHGDNDGYGDGHGYGNVDGTREFLSQPHPSNVGYPAYNRPAFNAPGSSSFASPRTGMAALDINLQGAEWPPMGGFQELLRSGGDLDGPNVSPPVDARSASRTLGFRAPRSSTGGGAGSGRATSTVSCGGRVGGGVPPVPAIGRGVRRGTSGVAQPSTARDKHPRVPAVADDNFASNTSNDVDNVEILPNAPTVFSLPIDLVCQFIFSSAHLLIDTKSLELQD